MVFSSSYKAALLSRLPAPVRRSRRFQKVHGHLPPLLSPETFNEKVNWRISFDRRPLLAHTCDKLAMKDHARRAADGLVTIPETLWFGADVAELADVALPRHWVLKPNHASQLVVFGEGPADPVQLAAETDHWLDSEYWRRNDEWAYRKARPGLLVEEFIGTPGAIPADYKVLVFGGVPRIVAVHSNRQGQHRNRLYTPDWEALPWTGGYLPGPDVPPPRRLADMMCAASLLATGYDMLRVDFYEHEGVLWFGELTPYPGAGVSRLEPELDALQGGWWTLPASGWRRLYPPRRSGATSPLGGPVPGADWSAGPGTTAWQPRPRPRSLSHRLAG